MPCTAQCPQLGRGSAFGSDRGDSGALATDANPHRDPEECHAAAVPWQRNTHSQTPGRDPNPETEDRESGPRDTTTVSKHVHRVNRKPPKRRTCCTYVRCTIPRDWTEGEVLAGSAVGGVLRQLCL